MKWKTPELVKKREKGLPHSPPFPSRYSHAPGDIEQTILISPHLLVLEIE